MPKNQSTSHTEGSNGPSSFSPCDPFDGPAERWRESVLRRAWVELGVNKPALSWPTPSCGTSLCLVFEHLAWEQPLKLAYPDGVCVYCGVVSGTRDHLLPRTWTGDAVRRQVLTVPACGECNSSIGDKYEPAVNGRRKLAHESIRRRKRRVLRSKDWTDAEISPLGPGIKSVVQKSRFEKRLVLARLAWPEDPDYDLRVMQLSGIANPYEIGILTPPTEQQPAA